MPLGSSPDDPHPPQVGVDAVSKEAHQRAIGKKVRPCSPGPGPVMGQSDPCRKAHPLIGGCSGRYNLKVAQGDPNNKFDPVSGHTVRFFKAELATSSHPRSTALHPHSQASLVLLSTRSAHPRAPVALLGRGCGGGSHPRKRFRKAPACSGSKKMSVHGVAGESTRTTSEATAWWPAGIVSTLHAFIACAGAARCLHMTPQLYEDMLWTTSNSARSRPASTPPKVYAP